MSTDVARGTRPVARGLHGCADPRCARQVAVARYVDRVPKIDIDINSGHDIDIDIDINIDINHVHDIEHDRRFDNSFDNGADNRNDRRT